MATASTSAQGQAVSILVEAALSYSRDWGLRLVPVQPGTNICSLQGWPERATSDEDTIREWFSREPSPNIGVLCHELLVIDIDGAEGKRGYQELRQAAGCPEELPKDFRTAESYFQETPGGHSLLFNVLEGTKTQRKIRAFPGIDLLGEGGYFVVAPSVRRDSKYDGRCYIANPEFGWLDAPSSLLELASTSTPGTVHTPTNTDNESMIPEGERNVRLASLAGRFVNAGLDYETIRNSLDAINREQCRPSLPADEVLQIVEQSAKWVRHEPKRAKFGSGEKQKQERTHFIEVYAHFEARVSSKPKPRPLIGELVTEQSQVLIHGQPREGKTLTLEELFISATTATPAFALDRFVVDEPFPAMFIHDEDPEHHVLDRFQWLLAGRGITRRPELLYLAVRRGVNLDDEEWQEALIESAVKYGVRMTGYDPMRAQSSAVDQGPSELKPLADFFRRFVQETGSAIVAVHHDTKPHPNKPDERKRPQRASGGGLYSIMDAPIHVEKFGTNKSLVVPSGFKHSSDPEPFTFRMEFEGKPVESLRLIGESTDEESAAMVALDEKILVFLRQHPESSTSAIGKYVSRSKDYVKARLTKLEGSDKVFGRPGPRNSTLWTMTGTIGT